MTINWKQSLVRRFRELEAIKLGAFKLSSGDTSHFYIDARKVTLDYFGLKAIVNAILELSDQHNLEYYLVGGPTLGADPIVGACLLELFDVNAGFLIRSQSKDHGTQQFIEGDVTSSEKYILVDDVVTTGNNLVRCIDLIGKKPVAVFSVLNRSNHNNDYFARLFGCKYFSLLNLEDIGLSYEKISEEVSQVK